MLVLTGAHADHVEKPRRRKGIGQELHGERRERDWRGRWKLDVHGYAGFI